MDEIILDLNEITKNYKNKQEDWLFIKNAIKSAIIDAKIEYGNDVKITFKERNTGFFPFDTAINGTAKNILENWDN